MDAVPTLSLVDRLRVCAALWAEANDATTAKLARLVINDGGFFTRLDAPGATTTAATLEKFARWLGEPANWPADETGARAVPQEVVAFVHVTGVSAVEARASAGKSGDLSTAREAAA